MQKVLAVLAMSAVFAGPVALPAAAQGQPTSPPAPAEELPREHLNLAQEVIELSKSDEAFDAILPRLTLMTQQTLTRQYPALTSEIEETVFDVAIEMAKRRVELSGTLQYMWALKFSPEELEELRAFFASETGQKFVEASPEITAASIDAARQWEQWLGELILRATTEKLRADGHAL